MLIMIIILLKHIISMNIESTQIVKCIKKYSTEICADYNKHDAMYTKMKMLNRAGITGASLILRLLYDRKSNR